MKKRIWLILLIAVICFTSCTPLLPSESSTNENIPETSPAPLPEASTPESEYPDDPVETSPLFAEYGAVAEYLVEEDGKLYLVLPISQTKVYAEHCKEHLYKVKLEDLAIADRAISEEIAKYPNNGGIGLSYDGHYLLIYFEAIVSIDPPNTQDGLDSGCGIDHNHVYYSNPIAADPLD